MPEHEHALRRRELAEILPLRVRVLHLGLDLRARRGILQVVDELSVLRRPRRRARRQARAARDVRVHVRLHVDAGTARRVDLRDRRGPLDQLLVPAALRW